MNNDKVIESRINIKKQIPFIVLLLVLTTILYIPALKNQFNNWDDNAYVKANQNISFTKENIRKSFMEGETHRMYAPITALTLSATYFFFEFNPKPYIIINIIIHLINTALVFFFLSLLFKNRYIPILTAALFAVHPMQVESVAYISGRRDVLYVLFYLFCLLFYVLYEKREKRYLLYYIISLIFAILALFSKGQALTIPASLIIISLFMGQNYKTKKFWLNKIPFIVLSAAIAYKVFTVTQYASGPYLDTAYLQSDIPFYKSIVYGCYGFIQYIILLVAPYKLSVVHPYPEHNGEYLIPFYFYFYIVIFLVLIFVFFRYAIKKKILWFGISFYAINIFMLLQLIPNSYGIINDHYVYLSCVGVFLVIIYFIAEFALNSKYRKYFIAVFSLCFVMLFYLSYERIYAFKNSVRLWTDVIKKYPDCYMAYNNRGNTFFLEGNFEKAISDYQSALKIKPESPEIYSNIGVAYNYQGVFDEAINNFSKAIKIKPAPETYYIRGKTYLSMGLQNNAMDDFNNAINLKKDFAEAYYSRGVINEKRNMISKAISDFNKAIEINPGFADPYFNAGNIFSNAGDYEKAISYYTRLIKFDTTNAEAYNKCGVIYGIIGNNDKAFACFSKAIKIKPDFAEAYNNRGVVFYKNGEYDLSIKDYSSAIEYAPGFAEAYNNRGAAYVSIKSFDNSCADFKKAEELGSVSGKENVIKFCK